MEYQLTPAGKELQPIIVQMGVWGRRWLQRQISREDLDVGLLMWDIRRRLKRERLPEERTVIRFDFRDAPKELSAFWLVLDDGTVDLCQKDPGYPVDLEVESDVLTLTRVWLGDVRYGDALDDESLRVRGPTHVRHAFPGWLDLSLFAQVELPGR